MRHLTIARSLIAGMLLAAFPLSPAMSVTTPPPTPAGGTALSHLQSKGATEIDRRIQNLNAALAKLNASTTLTAADKNALTKQVNDEIAGLTALKAKLAADTVLATARADVQSIIKDYRVYVLMLPKVRLVASADRFNVVENKLSDLQTKLAADVAKQKAAGKDVTAMQSAVTDMSSEIALAKSKTANIVSQLLALQPTDYNQSHTVLETYRAALKDAHDHLVKARDDAKTVITASPAASPR